MAQLFLPDSRRCSYFFLYDGSRVLGEGDLTREGICYFFPEETPIDKQELLCGQLAGVGRCVSELSSSPVRLLRLHRNKFAIHMKDDFFWALGCPVDVPTLSVFELLDQLINLFCFYNGPVRHCYQVYSQATLAAYWSQYLSYLLAGSTELHHVFSCLRTIDSTNVDPLLLLKAALILQACQRCPLVLAGCIFFRGRLVSTQMSPDLTMKVMFHESELHNKVRKPNGPSILSSLDSAISATTVFLTMFETQYLQSAAVYKGSRSPTAKDGPLTKMHLSRTLSDVPVTQKVSSSPHLSASDNCPPLSQNAAIHLPPSPPEPPLPNGESSCDAEEEAHETSHYHSFLSSDGETSHLNGADTDADAPSGTPCGCRGAESGNDDSHDSDVEEAGSDGSARCLQNKVTDPPPLLGSSEHPADCPLVPMTLYLHRVQGLVLALLVEPNFLSDSASMEEVYHSCLASLNGLEAHLRAIPPGLPGASGPYIFAHFDCIQSTMTTNLCGRQGGAPERSFVRATSLLHSHFCNTETLQEAIIRSAGAAVYGTRSVAQETYFLQQGVSLRNSGIPNHQDSAFSLPSKARHRLLKHGVNLL